MALVNPGLAICIPGVLAQAEAQLAICLPSVLAQAEASLAISVQSAHRHRQYKFAASGGERRWPSAGKT